MKLLTSLLLFISFLANAQERFEGDFYVLTIHSDTIVIDQRKVVIAYDMEAKEVCVATDILRCFTDLTPLPTTDEFLGSMKSVLGDTYIMRIVFDDDGMTIWFTNVDNQYPHLVITTREPK